MEIHTEYVEPGTSAISYGNVSFSKTEDSGYHTFTPGSLERAEISDDFLDQPVVTGITGQIQFGYFHSSHIVTPEVNSNLSRRYAHSTANIESPSDTPIFRRGCKRPHSSTLDKSESYSNSIPTPTSYIAGKIKNLDVNENKENSDILLVSSPITSSDNFKRCYNFDQIVSYPTTPVKRNCVRSPCRKSGRNLNFAIHSLSCNRNELQSTITPRISKAARNINFWPDQKVDIIQKLYQDAGAVPPIMQILSYLSNEDVHNFSIVWNNIWKAISENNKKKKEYEGYINYLKENQENKGVTPKINILKPVRCLKEINNELNNQQEKTISAHTPPASPRTRRFRTFTKSASLDSRSQLSCVRCCLPAKVTEEPSGEVWVECTGSSCLYKFCKFCKCNRHPGKFCFQYDLNVPSPSKRKKNQYAVGTKKSKRNLQRL